LFVRCIPQTSIYRPNPSCKTSIGGARIRFGVLHPVNMDVPCPEINTENAVLRPDGSILPSVFDHCFTLKPLEPARVGQRCFSHCTAKIQTHPDCYLTITAMGRPLLWGISTVAPLLVGLVRTGASWAICRFSVGVYGPFDIPLDASG